MAKKAAKPTATPKRGPLAQLANRLVNTSGNVYRIAEEIGIKIPPGRLFSELRKHEAIFKCRECNTWKGIDVESEIHDVCCECQHEIDSDD